MLTVDEIKKDIDELRFGKTKQRIVAYVEAEENRDVVFTGNDISEAFSSFTHDTIISYIDDLVRHGKIGRIKFGNKVYYGGKEVTDDIEKFRRDRTGGGDSKDVNGR